MSSQPIKKSFSSKREKRGFRGAPQIAWSNTQVLDPPGIYIIGQIQKLYVILILQLNDESMWQNKSKLPVIMNLRKKTNESYSLWDMVKVTKHQTVSVNGLQKAVQYFEANIIRHSAVQGVILPSTLAIEYEWIQRTPMCEIPALVQFSDTRHGTTIVSFTASMMTGQEEVYDEMIKLPHLPAAGDIVLAEASVLPETELEYKVYSNQKVYRYYLPKAYMGTEPYGLIIGPGRAAARSVSLYTGITFEEARKKFRQEPAARRFYINFMENLIYTSAVYYETRTKDILIQTAFYPTDIVCKADLISWATKQAMLEFSIPFNHGLNPDTLFAQRMKYWLPKVKLRIETSQSSMHLSCSGMTATIIKREIRNRTIYLQLYMNHDEVTLALHHASEVMNNQKHEGLFFYPNTDNVGHETRNQVFKKQTISQILLDENQKFTARRIILQQLFDFISTTIAVSGKSDARERAKITSATFHLDSSQETLFTALWEPSIPLIYAQAAAGTGKTFTISVYLSEMLKRKVGVILVTAPTSNAVKILIKNFLNLNPTTRPGEILLLQSVISEKLCLSGPDEIWENYRLPETLKYYQNQVIGKDQSAFALEYIERRITHSGQVYHENEALQLLLKLKAPRIVFGTVPQILNFISQWNEIYAEDNLQYLVIDDGGLISEMTLMALVALLPNLEKVLISGDKYQLPVHLMNLPDTLLSYGHKGAVSTLANNAQISKVTLNVNYRSHPVLVAALAEAAYEMNLIPGLMQEQRALWRALQFPVGFQETPLLFIQVKEEEIQSVISSKKSTTQIEMAIALWKYIRNYAKNATIAILCYYEVAAEEIRQISPDVYVFNINQFRGRESDFTILVTTRLGQQEECTDKSQYSFLLDQQQTTVALSRAKEGSFIIGDYDILQVSSMWKVIIDKYAKHCQLTEIYEWVIAKVPKTCDK